MSAYTIIDVKYVIQELLGEGGVWFLSPFRCFETFGLHFKFLILTFIKAIQNSWNRFKSYFPTKI